MVNVVPVDTPAGSSCSGARLPVEPVPRAAVPVVGEARRSGVLLAAFVASVLAVLRLHALPAEALHDVVFQWIHVGKLTSTSRSGSIR